MKGELSEYTLGSDGILRYQDLVFLPRDQKIKDEVLRDVHCSKYKVQPGNNKMYQDLK